MTQRVVAWLRRKRTVPAITPQPVVLPPAPPAPMPETIEIPANRHERRRLEKARRKHDKFVTPQGPEPTPVSRTAEPKPRTKRVEVIVPDAVDDAEILIADRHHEGPRQERVLYKEAEVYGEFNFRDTILQQLERYFVYLDRMKKRDPQSYAFYRQVGATILPYVANGTLNRSCHRQRPSNFAKRKTPLAGWFNKQRPAFGCFAYGADPETEKHEHKGKQTMAPKFMYFRKYTRPPPEIQPMSGGDTYVMTVWWDDPLDRKMKHGTPTEFGIHISADGKQLTALRVIDTKMVQIYSKRKHETFRVPQRAWHMPRLFDDWAHEHGDEAQHFLTELFLMSVEMHETAQYSMVRVAAAKDDMTAVFSVNIHRMGYFFQDRDIQLNEAGTRKRIFHIVRAHTRRDGRTVPFHFRGERQFSWAGYDVMITVPGRDHYNFNDVDFGAVDDYWAEKSKDYVGMEEIGEQIADCIKHGVGGVVH